MRHLILEFMSALPVFGLSFILPIIAGLAGLTGGGKQQTQKQSGTQTGTTSGTSTTSGTQTSAPNFSPLQQHLIDLFTGGLQDQFSSTANLSPYTSQGLQQIGAQGGANRNILNNIIASRGLSFSPAATNAETSNVLNTGNQMSQFLSSIPLLQRQLQERSLQNLIGGFGAIPTGTTSTSTGTTSGNQTTTGSYSGTGTTSGNPLAGLFGGFGAGLAAPSATPGVSNLMDIINMFKPKPAMAPAGGDPNAWQWGH